jgi:hypothetical protein
LLNSKDEAGIALGNDHDRVGRGFMNHPKGYVGEVRFTRPLDSTHPFFNLRREHFRGYVGLRVDESRQDGTLNCYLRLEPLHGPMPNLRATVKSALRSHLREAISRGLAALKDLWNVVTTLEPAISGGAIKRARVRCFVEMEPSQENRITLSERSDSLGVAIPIVRYRVSELALNSAATLLSRFASELSALGIGMFKPYASPLRDLLEGDASHHLGGTPMGPDPRNSVVTPDLMLHGVDNVYVAGGSVFPTGGSANPTLTMIGLSLRLADTVQASLSPPISKVRPISATSQGIIVVGGGRRVAEDVVPAIEALGEFAHIQSIYATRPGVVFGGQRAWEVRPIVELQEREIASARAVYIAVPQGSVPTVLTALRRFDCRRLHLVVDTPVVSSKSLIADYHRFRTVHVAEDSSFLPWLPVVHAHLDETRGVRAIEFRNSAYRYHAFALAKAIARARPNQHGAIKTAYRIRRRTRLWLASGLLVVMDEPRDYDSGRLNIHLADGSVLSSHPRTDLIIECLRDDGHCIGFSVSNNTTYLSDIEREMVGRFTESDNIVTRMLEMKRVGLYRLLMAVLSDRSTYSLADGVQDAEVSRALARFHFYHRGLRGRPSAA